MAHMGLAHRAELFGLAVDRLRRDATRLMATDRSVLWRGPERQIAAFAQSWHDIVAAG